MRRLESTSPVSFTTIKETTVSLSFKTGLQRGKVLQNSGQDARAKLFLLLVRVQSWKERSEIPSSAVNIFSVLYLVSITIHIYKVLIHTFSY